MLPTDKLFIKDQKGDPNSLEILNFIRDNMENIFRTSGRIFLVFRITTPQIQEGTIIEALKTKKIDKIPAVSCYNGQPIQGTQNIKSYYINLLKSPKPTSQPQKMIAPQESNFNDYYRDEIIGKGQENDGDSAELDMSKSYRQRLKRRKEGGSANEPVEPQAQNQQDMPQQNFDSNPTNSNNPDEDLRRSVEKAADEGGVDGDLEMAWFENNIGGTPGM